MHTYSNPSSNPDRLEKGLESRDPILSYMLEISGFSGDIESNRAVLLAGEPEDSLSRHPTPQCIPS